MTDPREGKWMPAEPTLEMQRAYFDSIDKYLPRVETDAGFGRFDNHRLAYRAMYAAFASPEPDALVGELVKALEEARQFVNDSGPDDDPEWRANVVDLLARIDAALTAERLAAGQREERLRTALEEAREEIAEDHKPDPDNICSLCHLLARIDAALSK